MLNLLQLLGQHEILLISCPLFFTLLVIFLIRPTGGRKLNLPPSPAKLPIIGNLHKLGRYPHRSLYVLAQRFGPLMLLRFGNVPVLVVSSADAACEIKKTHDLTFINGPKFSVAKKLLYDYKDVASAPYGEYWRQMRSICVLNLLSNKMVKSYRAIREEETALAMACIKRYCSSGLLVNLTELFSATTNNVICRIALGRKYNEDTNKFKKLLSEFLELLGTPSIGDYLPWLAWLSHVNGFNARADKVAKEFDEFLDGVIEEHLNRRNGDGNDQKDFVDVLLEIQKQDSVGFPIERNSIKAIILDVFSAGTDTTFTVLEWAMTELLRHPKAIKELQNEARKVAGGKSSISEDDLHNMHYLKAVIKETLRLHPPIPTLLPRVSTKDVKINGYDIAEGTLVIINAWAIGRDPSTWEKPEEFLPDRFLNNPIDFKGQHFELIPFGSGRRICPGILLAMHINELLLANLVHKFDWSLPGGASEKDLDMTECTGLTIHKSSPLIAIANQCPF
ncbi:cytochrome P450, family 71, subfamily A, polypeptide 25 [Hibiscus trionum]|uniref:Cytochrome P450, family 71, subfamily A, polypeptide 25 n=1 Tax=Hibiscus trionum TaxID=183268 RepID=A0A9W7IP13_HIBTR|nr:cytochrome P450, family 71, subfamily A, polypeptide 25 [Hibiscus trionum]